MEYIAWVGDSVTDEGQNLLGWGRTTGDRDYAVELLQQYLWDAELGAASYPNLEAIVVPLRHGRARWDEAEPVEI